MTPVETASVSFRDAFRFWLKLGFISSPRAEIAIMHQELVERRRLLPGPEAQPLATYVGWLLHGTRGGLVAGLCPSCPASSSCGRSPGSTRSTAGWPRWRPSSPARARS